MKTNFKTGIEATTGKHVAIVCIMMENTFDVATMARLLSPAAIGMSFAAAEAPINNETFDSIQEMSNAHAWLLADVDSYIEKEHATSEDRFAKSQSFLDKLRAEGTNLGVVDGLQRLLDLAKAVESAKKKGHDASAGL